MNNRLKKMTFENLVESIRQSDNQLARQTGKAVNISLTLRNWLIGYQISIFELKGADRARYGERLLADLAKKLTLLNISNCNKRQLYRYARFYKLYPKIVGTLSPQLQKLLPFAAKVAFKMGTAYPQLQIPPQKLIANLSYSQIEQIAEFSDPLKRIFYEVECIRGNWSVRELQRQIATLYYERSAYSKNKKKLAELVKLSAEENEPSLTIRDPYIFEFLKLKPTEVVGETDFENALANKIKEFLLELGHGFCFEARQKRILIGNKHCFIDLVFYHRILKCHILVELKVDEFSHEHLGQLNTYVSWYKKNCMTHGDHPPIGILLCTQKDHSLVEYALADMKNNLFVSKYQVELPKKDEILRFIEEQMRQTGSIG